MVSVEQWAEIRRMHLVERLSIREIRRRTGLHRDTIRRALGSRRRRAYSRARRRPSKLDPFGLDPRAAAGGPVFQSLRLREMASELGYRGGKTIFDDYVREVRPRFLVRRTFQRTVYRPGRAGAVRSVGAARVMPVGYGQTRRGYVVTAGCAGRGWSPARWCSPRRRWTCCGGGSLSWRIGALPEKLVWDREGGITPAAAGRPKRSRRSAGSSGRLADPRRRRRAGQGPARALQRLHADQLRAAAGGSPTSSTSSSSSTRWFDERVNPRMHRTLRARPVDRLVAGARADARRCPRRCPDCDRRW